MTNFQKLMADYIQREDLLALEHAAHYQLLCIFQFTIGPSIPSTFDYVGNSFSILSLTHILHTIVNLSLSASTLIFKFQLSLSLSLSLLVNYSFPEENFKFLTQFLFKLMIKKKKKPFKLKD